MSREVRVVELYQNYSLGDIPGILRRIANDIEEGKREADSAHLILVDADGHIDEFFSAGRFVFTRHSLMGMLEDAKLYIHRRLFQTRPGIAGPERLRLRLHR